MRSRLTVSTSLCLGMLICMIPGIALGAVTSEADASPPGDKLLQEILGLRLEIGQLRAEIKELRAEIATLKAQMAAGQAVQPKGPKVETPGVSTGTARIEFTAVPGPGAGGESGGSISGRISGVSTADQYKVVLYAHTDWWYVQPLVDAPFTAVRSDGTWSSWIHLGDRYAALLVRSSFKPEAKTQKLPAVGGDVIATAETPAR